MATNLFPHNPTTGNTYSGDNISRLVAAQEAAGYPTAEWAGYGQWLDKGRQVRKGEKSTVIVMFVTKKDAKTGTEKRIPKSARVFNIAQTDAVAAVSDVAQVA